MAEKLKKKPSIFSLKRWTDDRGGEGSHSPLPQRSPSTKYATREKPRKLSAGGIKELVQCPLCLETLHNPKMLPCQHTFCYACLSVYIADLPIIDCPICHTKIQVMGSSFIDNLPSNLYIDSLLNMVGIKSAPKPDSPLINAPAPPVTVTPAVTQSVDLFAGGTRCSQCKSMCDCIDVSCCEHCKMNFCRVCWSQHLDDMRTQIGSILKQLDSAANRLEHKVEHYKDRCERIAEHINLAADEKINEIIEARDNLLKQTSDLQKSGNMSALALKTSLEDAKMVASREMSEATTDQDHNKVNIFVNLHQNALQILSDVSKWDTEAFIFDKEGFRIELDSGTPFDAESDDPIPEEVKQNDPLENEETLFMHYRSRTFVPHYQWRKASRPGGVAISPWTGHLYVCGMDAHAVLVVERAQARTVSRLAHTNMLCPAQLAFMKSLGEVYVTDKWKHCVHVFSKDGEYLRCIGQKGSRLGMFRSPEGIAADNSQQLIYVVDTGNDRVQVLQPDGKYVDQIGVILKQQPTNTASVWETQEVPCTELNAPTSVAVFNDRVIILDSGNKRVKVYNKQNKSKIAEFGSMGQRKGQFRHPEVLTVDPLGFILVGDSGNCRVQVFKQSGQLVRVFGGYGLNPGRFGWISGIYVTKQLDIIVSDKKTSCVNFF